MTTPATQYARAGDTSIAYQVLGDGPLDLVLVWGTMSHVEMMWEDPFTAHFLNSLAAFTRLILFDKRGCGMSDRASGQPTLEERMEDVRAVMDAAGSERAAIWGESEGGPMSIMFAATYPERTVALVLYGAFVRWVDETFAGAWSQREYMNIVDRCADRWGQGEAMAWFAPSWTELDPVMLRELGGKFERAAFSPGAFRELMAMNAQIDARPLASSVTVPTLVLHRTGDRVVDVRQARWIAAHIPGARLVEFDGIDHLVSAGDSQAVIDETQEFLTGARRTAPTDRVLATVMFTDIVDSTSRAADVGDARWTELLDRHDEIIGQQVSFHRGHRVKSTGDGVLATFDGPARAVRCASEIIRSAAAVGIAVRAGVHTGEIELRGDDIGGLAVHVSARIAALAESRQVLTSRTVKDLVAGSGINFTDMGTHTLKGVPETWQLYKAVAS